jgi:hypothetical protein
VVVVAVGAVGVAVGELLGGGVADGGDLDGEVEGDAGEGVVEIEGDLVALDGGDPGGDGALAVRILGLDLDAGLT